jgi:ATP-dependent DNA helicase RecQ
MIDDGTATEDFKRVQRGKLDALLALAEAHDCRRVRLLAYFGETYAGPPDARAPLDDDGRPLQAVTRCGNCDNCLDPPVTWDGTEAARKLLSCIYRFQQHGEQRFGARAFGAGHLIDVLRGKLTDKVKQYGHEALSTFGVGADLTEAHWRAVLRQLVALGHVVTEGEFNTLALTPGARAVLKGEVTLLMKQPAEPVARGRKRGAASGGARAADRLPADLDAAAQARFDALKAWRAEVAREHSLPAYVIFQNATLIEMARRQPGTLADLGEISGVGARKLEAYGREILRVLDRL